MQRGSLGDRVQGRAVASGLLALGLVAGATAIVVAGLDSSSSAGSPHTASGVVSDTACPDQKVGLPQSSCWMPPAGYVPAPKDGSDAAIARPSPSSVDSTQNFPSAGTITDQFAPPFSGSQFTVNTEWWNYSGGTYVRVFAGSLGTDTSQGVIVVLTGPINNPGGTSAPSLQAYPSPSKDGTLTITGSRGWSIDLSAADGATFVFNATTNSY